MTTRLVCPSCRTSQVAEERFCTNCGMPLVLADATEPPLTERRERARKISPQYAEGQLVKVGWARNQAEAELMAGMLLEEGVPSVVRRAGGFDVPDFLAAGPRDILVAASGADVARDLLGTSAPVPVPRRRLPVRPWVRAVAFAMLAVTVVAVLAGLVSALIS